MDKSCYTFRAEGVSYPSICNHTKLAPAENCEGGAILRLYGEATLHSPPAETSISTRGQVYSSARSLFLKT